MRTLEIPMPAILASLLCLVSFPLAAQEPKVTPVMTKELTDMPGKEILVLSVEYSPGGTDIVHRHNADATVYVLEGTVIEQVKGGKPDTLTAGETFFEGTEDIHIVGRNASNTQPAKILAILVKNNGAPALEPVKQK
jgi:quercetin dioxygenase-like cupin family protein